LAHDGSPEIWETKKKFHQLTSQLNQFVQTTYIIITQTNLTHREAPPITISVDKEIIPRTGVSSISSGEREKTKAWTHDNFVVAPVSPFLQLPLFF
jgi:hypothetical protein